MATILRTRAVLGLSTGAIPCLMTHYWDSTGAASGALATESVARVRAAFAAASGSISNSVTYSPVLVVDEIDENTGAIVNQFAASAPAATSGASASPVLPLQTQCVVQYQTGLFIAGRRLRGRSYIPGMTVGGVAAGGGVAAAVLTALAAFNTALGTTILTATNQRVWHRPNALGVGGLSAVVTTRSVNSQFGVMRSRRR